MLLLIVNYHFIADEKVARNKQIKIDTSAVKHKTACNYRSGRPNSRRMMLMLRGLLFPVVLKVGAAFTTDCCFNILAGAAAAGPAV